MKSFRGLVLSWLFVSALLVVAAGGDEGAIVVVVEGSETTDGSIRISVYGSKDSFLREPVLNRAAKPGPEGRTEIVFRRDELPPEFAIILYHDVNDNGEMETGFMRIPKEPYGLSNNPGFRMGPPRYAASVVNRDSIEDALVIRLK